jgi:hypothetical protein
MTRGGLTGAAPGSRRKAADEADRQRAIRHLRQLVDALNRRVPHVERVGEATIARDAAELMKKALKRLKALEESD